MSMLIGQPKISDVTPLTEPEIQQLYDTVAGLFASDMPVDMPIGLPIIALARTAATVRALQKRVKELENPVETPKLDFSAFAIPKAD